MMTIPAIVTATLFANGLTIGALYCLWSIQKKGETIRHLLGFIAICIIAALFALGVAHQG